MVSSALTLVASGCWAAGTACLMLECRGTRPALLSHPPGIPAVPLTTRVGEEQLSPKLEPLAAALTAVQHGFAICACCPSVALLLRQPACPLRTHPAFLLASQASRRKPNLWLNY